MKIANIILNGNFTDGMAYQENCLPYYQKKVFRADVVIIAGQYSLVQGTKKSKINSTGEYVLSNGIRLIRIKNFGGRFIGKKLAYMPSLFDTLEVEKPDYLFVHLIQSLSLIDIVKYKNKHPKTIIYGDSHADYINSAHGWISRNILHRVVWGGIIRSASQSFEKIYGVLPSRVSFLREMYRLSEDKVDLLLMGAEDELIDYSKHDSIRTRIRSELSIRDEDFVIITGGKIDCKKNITVLIDAILKLNNSNVKLLIFGSLDQEMCDYLDRIKTKCFIIYIGWIDSKQMYEYFQAADLCCFPGTHSVIWEQAVGYGMPGIFRFWNGIDHIDCEGNMEFFYNNSVDEMVKLLNKIILSPEVYKKMKVRAEEIKIQFQYSTLALKSLGEHGTIEYIGLRANTPEQGK